MEAILDKTRQIMKIDITTGDAITPKAVEYCFRLLFEDRTINILAEKLETILLRGTASTKMRDYYDVFILTTLRSQEINWDMFVSAFRKTAEKRGTYTPLIETGHDNISEIEKSQALSKLWDRYHQKNNYASDLSWKESLASVKNLYLRTF